MSPLQSCASGMQWFCRTAVCENIKLVLATIAVFLLILIVFIGVSLRYCVLQLHPAINFVLLFGALTLLAYCEALHYICVAVEKWDMSKYEAKYPRAVRCHKLIDTPEKVKKFLVGRQFFVIFVVFLIASITSFPYIPHDFAGMPKILVVLLAETGLPGVALVLTFGQLISQIYAEEYTIPFLNLYGCNFVIRLSLFAEYIGVCNFSWLLYFCVSRLVCRKVIHAQKTIDENTLTTSDGLRIDDDPVSPTEKIRGPNFDLGVPKKTLTWFDYLKYCWSSVATLGSLAIIFYGIINKHYVLDIPVFAAFIIAFGGMTILFVLEGLMIAISATQYWDKEVFKTYYPYTYFLHDVINQPDNVKRFIIGRQFCTVLTNFLLAQVFTFANWKNTSLNPVLFYIVIKSGLVGVLTTLAFGQLMPELLAAEYPLRFMNMWMSVAIGYISLIFDAIGVGHCAWAVYFVTRRCVCSRSEASDDATEQSEADKPRIVRVNSAEILAKATNNPVNRV